MGTPTRNTISRRTRRSKAEIETAIEIAAIEQIKERGFALALVTEIVKHAKIEPTVFYNRYRNLEEFYNNFVKKYDYWLSDKLRALPHPINSPGRLSKTIKLLMQKLLDDPIMTQLLRWEISEGTQITKRTAQLREMDINTIISRFSSIDTERLTPDYVAISSLITAGIYFMVLHKDRSTFAGIDLNSPNGRQRIENAIDQITKMLSASATINRRKEKLIASLKSEGLNTEAINRCLKAIGY